MNSAAGELAREPFSVVFAAAEAFPFAKTGGLGDVVGALPIALERIGCRPCVIIPAHRSIRSAGLPIEDLGLPFVVAVGSKHVSGSILRGTLPGSQVPIYFIKQDDYFDRPSLYGEHNESYVDNCERFVFFCRAVLEAIRLLEIDADLLHCHDWHAGLLPALLKLEYRAVPRYERIASLMTIHNIQYQGEFWHWDMLLTGLDWRYFNWRQMEAFGKLNLLKTGIVFADGIGTVSPRYAEEIQTPDFGCRLEGVLQFRREALAGIINGVDYGVWNPRTDRWIEANYGPADVQAGKAKNKSALQSQLGLEARADLPLLGFIGRLVKQKGIDLIADVLNEWAATSDTQWVFLGEGDPELEGRLNDAARRFPQRVKVIKSRDEELAHRIEAAADIFMMPSRFEPCGLNQLYSLKYGTVPVAHCVGGLADTVVDATPENLAAGKANGFSFTEFNTHRFGEALARACETYRERPEVWRQLQQTGMQQDWSWTRSAADYVELYGRTVAAARQVQVVVV